MHEGKLMTVPNFLFGLSFANIRVFRRKLIINHILRFSAETSGSQGVDITHWRVSSESLEGGHLFFTPLFLAGNVKQSGKKDYMRVSSLSPFTFLNARAKTICVHIIIGWGEHPPSTFFRRIRMSSAKPCSTSCYPLLKHHLCNHILKYSYFEDTIWVR